MSEQPSASAMMQQIKDLVPRGRRTRMGIIEVVFLIPSTKEGYPGVQQCHCPLLSPELR